MPGMVLAMWLAQVSYFLSLFVKDVFLCSFLFIYKACYNVTISNTNLFRDSTTDGFVHQQLLSFLCCGSFYGMVHSVDTNG